MIPYSRQIISESDINEVLYALKADLIAQGPINENFSSKIAEHCQANFACTSNSATSALHIAYKALGLGDGDWLWTSPNTFVSTANMAIHCGAKVDFVDIDAETYNLCPNKLEDKLKLSAKNGTLPQIVVPVHFAGQSCDMEAIYHLSQKYHFKVVEDASHAIGSTYKNKVVGCCDFSDITVFSFHAIKIITSAEGGACVTNEPDLLKKMQRLTSHGIVKDQSHFIQMPEEEWWGYQQFDLGYNYRLTELQAALGLSQLHRLSEIVKKRRELAKCYDDQLYDLPSIVPPKQEDYGRSCYHLYPVLITQSATTTSRNYIMANLLKKGIGVNLHYIPVYLQPYFKKLGFERGYCPVSEEYFKNAISLPLHLGINEQDISKIVNILKDEIK